MRSGNLTLSDDREPSSEPAGVLQADNTTVCIPGRNILQTDPLQTQTRTRKGEKKRGKAFLDWLFTRQR